MKKKIEIERVITGVPQDQSIGQDLEDMMRRMTDVVETDGKHYRRRYRSHSSFTEFVDQRESNEEDRDHECSKPRHHSRHSLKKDVWHVAEDKKLKDHKQSRKKHRSQLSSIKRRPSSKKRSDEENESDRDGRDHRHSRIMHRSQHSSGHGKDNHRHRSRHSSGDKKLGHHLKHDSSSDDAQNHTSLDKSGKEMYDERDELEEGEISSKVSEGSRGIASGHVSRETSVDTLISHERVNSQPPECAGVLTQL